MRPLGLVGRHVRHLVFVTSSKVRYMTLNSSPIILCLLVSDTLKFTEYILGTEWIDDPPLQRDIVEFIYRFHAESLLKLSDLPTQYATLHPSGGYKEEEEEEGTLTTRCTSKLSPYHSTHNDIGVQTVTPSNHWDYMYAHMHCLKQQLVATSLESARDLHVCMYDHTHTTTTISKYLAKKEYSEWYKQTL